MNVYEVLPGYQRLGKLTDVSKEARRRLKLFDYYYSHGQNARLTCPHFDISPQTFYRWKKRHSGKHLETLENRSHRLKRVRQPEYSPQLVEAVRSLREQYPRWGKDKLVVLLRTAGFSTSTSTEGRILGRLKQRGLLHEPLCNGISARKRQRTRPYAVKKPKEYVAAAPGDIVQVDTLDVRPLPGVVIKHFTARESRAGMYSKHTPGPRHGPPLPSSMCCWSACHSPSRRSKSMAAQNSGTCSRRSARSEAFASSSCRHAHPSSMDMWNGRREPIPRNSTNSPTRASSLPNSTRPCANGNASMIPYAHINPSATSPRNSSCTNAITTERR